MLAASFRGADIFGQVPSAAQRVAALSRNVIDRKRGVQRALATGSCDEAFAIYTGLIEAATDLYTARRIAGLPLPGALLSEVARGAMRSGFANRCLRRDGSTT